VFRFGLYNAAARLAQAGLGTGDGLVIAAIQAARREAMREILHSIGLQFSFPLHLTRSALSPTNDTLRRVLLRAGNQRHRVLVAVDTGVLEATPGLPLRLRRYAEAHADVLELVAAPFPVRGGEICKTDPREVAELHALIARHRLCRHSFVLAIGGGSMLDAIGYAAATAHRGVRLIRMPTTVLAQNDAGIGVKNAVNFRGRKNFVGTFAPPFAVIDDFEFLETLPERDRRSGIAEAFKVALIKDRDFFDFIQLERNGLAAFDSELLEAMIARCAELHLEHICSGGDPFELGSARPLDFGHWSAHKLEELSRGELRHGEAVAIGVAIDSVYSQQLGLIGEIDLFEILSTLEALGFQLHHPTLSQLDVEEALLDFREHLGGDLCLTLIGGIGNRIERRDIDLDVMKKCVDVVARRARLEE
jgi:3-dehydroquinate synthase